MGSALVARLTREREPVRCLVRDPRRLGDHRVRVQLAMGDLVDPPSFRNALRGVHTVIHLAASIRDEQRASIEELNAMATLRLVRAAERAGAQRFIFFSALGAEHHSRTRFFRAKALAEQAVEASGLETVVFSPSIVYTPGDPWLTLLERFSYLPAIPVSGSGRSLYQPIWAEDVADCVMASLSTGGSGHRRYELAGPETLSYDQIVRVAHAADRPPATAAPCAAAGGAGVAAGPGPRRRPAGLRHLGGGRADGGAHDHPARHGGRRVAGGHPAADAGGGGQRLSGDRDRKAEGPARGAGPSGNCGE